MADIALELITPQKTVLEARVSEVVAPGLLGEFTVLPGHAPFLAQIRPGRLRVTEGGQVKEFAVGSGFAEVLAGRVMILTSVAESKAEINVDRAREALDQAVKAIQPVGLDDPRYAALSDDVAFQEARLQVAASR